MSWQLIVDPYARKYIKRIPRRDAERITAVLRELVADLMQATSQEWTKKRIHGEGA